MKLILTSDILKTIMPLAQEKDIEYYLDGLNVLLIEYEINTGLRMAHFLAQIAYESDNFRYKSENLNYSEKALRAVFGKYFKSDDIAEDYARNPECIANVVYADRMGNGDIASGDGWRYRGRGLIQLTGCENYTDCGEAIGKALKAQPDLVLDDPKVAVAAACWYWSSRKLNKYADLDDIKAITKRINGGYNGLPGREEYLARAKTIFAM